MMLPHKVTPVPVQMEKCDEERHEHAATDASMQKAQLDLLAKVISFLSCVWWHCCFKELTVLFIYFNRLLVCKNLKIDQVRMCHLLYHTCVELSAHAIFAEPEPLLVLRSPPRKVCTLCQTWS